jgi:hypothetical protein
MPPPESVGSLRRLLVAAGYRLEDRTVGLLAVRRSDGRSVLLIEGDRSPAEVEREFPPDQVHRTLVYAEEPGTAAREMAAQRGMEVLGPSSLGPALGELLLGGPTGAHPETGTPELETPAQLVPEGDRLVRPRLSQSDAEARSGVEASRYVLRLVPFYVAPYRVRVVTTGGTRAPPSDHLVAVNAISRQVEVWEANEREIVTNESEDVPRLAPRIPPEEARALAEAAIRRRHTVSVDHTEQLGGVVVIESRRVAPGPEDLRIGASVLVHVPYWYIESSRGRVVLDAVTGARVPDTEPEAAPGP